MSATYAPRPALVAYNAATFDRFARLTEDAAMTFLDDVPGSITEGRAMRHYAPAESYPRTA